MVEASDAMNGWQGWDTPKKQFILIMKVTDFLHWAHIGNKDKENFCKVNA